MIILKHMGRPARFERSDIAEAALRLVADGGPHALTVAALARELGAPTGSIYHRYASRDQLLGELWMDVVEGFQSGFVACLDGADGFEGAVTAAHFMCGWVREHPIEARVLLLHRRQDFVAGAWPAELVERAGALEPQLGAALRGFARRALGSAGREAMARLRYALLDAPLGAVKPYVQSHTPIPAVVDELIEATVRAALAPIAGTDPAEVSR